MRTPTYTPPENPANPVEAALELILRVPRTILGHDRFTPVLFDYTAMLRGEGAFAGLSWSDASVVAFAIAVDVVMRDDAQQHLTRRASLIEASDGTAFGVTWDDKQAAARALRIAAGVLAL
jgi:hypothetical protein